jgi:hypothetical protein
MVEHQFLPKLAKLARVAKIAKEKAIIGSPLWLFPMISYPISLGEGH